nr:DUF5522 domain-containing protein [Pedosphaera parvula]
MCQACVTAFHRRHKTVAQPLLPNDFYFDPGGLLVLTAAYHLRRGFCCGSGCRHCPYKENKSKAPGNNPPLP